MKEITWLIYSILFICMGLCVIAGIIYCQNVRLREEIKKNRRNSTYTNVDQNWQKLYNAYSEERQMAEWIQMRLEDEKIDLPLLAEGANARTIALVIKFAEEEVNSAAITVKKVQEKINHIRNHLINSSSHEPYNASDKDKDERVIEALREQETAALKHLEEAQESLKKLTASIKETATQPKPILTPEDLGG